MKTPEDKAWQNLLAQSAETFKGETELPYGFMTSTLARLRSENAEREQLEKMGKWAIFASLATLGFAVLLTVQLHFKDRGELDPGLGSIALVENTQVY